MKLKLLSASLAAALTLGVGSLAVNAAPLGANLKGMHSTDGLLQKVHGYHDGRRWSWRLRWHNHRRGWHHQRHHGRRDHAHRNQRDDRRDRGDRRWR